jgi:hypothetical protein
VRLAAKAAYINGSRPQGQRKTRRMKGLMQA